MKRGPVWPDGQIDPFHTWRREIAQRVGRDGPGVGRRDQRRWNGSRGGRVLQTLCDLRRSQVAVQAARTRVACRSLGGDAVDASALEKRPSVISATVSLWPMHAR